MCILRNMDKCPDLYLDNPGHLSMVSFVLVYTHLDL